MFLSDAGGGGPSLCGTWLRPRLFPRPWAGASPRPLRSGSAPRAAAACAPRGRGEAPGPFPSPAEPPRTGPRWSPQVLADPTVRSAGRPDPASPGGPRTDLSPGGRAQAASLSSLALRGCSGPLADPRASFSRCGRAHAVPRLVRDGRGWAARGSAASGGTGRAAPLGASGARTQCPGQGCSAGTETLICTS